MITSDPAFVDVIATVPLVPAEIVLLTVTDPIDAVNAIAPAAFVVLLLLLSYLSLR